MSEGVKVREQFAAADGGMSESDIPACTEAEVLFARSV